ncbi:hypothetical protein EDC01DRAFT_657302 [Geopyxis carbonaria]|nr:hypothetical protein EDC01DRAFT_657302 [Geopyxis carbonaria]
MSAISLWSVGPLVPLFELESGTQGRALNMYFQKVPACLSPPTRLAWTDPGKFWGVHSVSYYIPPGELFCVYQNNIISPNWKVSHLPTLIKYHFCYDCVFIQQV